MPFPAGWPPCCLCLVSTAALHPTRSLPGRPAHCSLLSLSCRPLRSSRTQDVNKNNNPDPDEDFAGGHRPRQRCRGGFQAAMGRDALGHLCPRAGERLCSQLPGPAPPGVAGRSPSATFRKLQHSSSPSLAFGSADHALLATLGGQTSTVPSASSPHELCGFLRFLPS